VLLETAAAIGFRVDIASTAVPEAAGESSPSVWVAVHGRPLTVDDLSEDPRFARSYDRPARGTVASYLGVPLRIGNDVIGVLEVFSRERRSWRGDEVRLLLTFASQAAVAFQNARLAQENERARRTARLLERLLAMTTQTEPPQPEEIVAALALGLNAPVVTLYRHDGVWMAGPASVPPDTVPLAALVEAARRGGGTAANFQMVVAPEGKGARVAVAVLVPAGLSAPDANHLLLETAAHLLDREPSNRLLPSG
jgi:hypothetical protein